jgi:hypothetical protein
VLMLANARQRLAVLAVVVVGMTTAVAADNNAATPTATVSGSATLVPPANTSVNVSAAGTYDMKGFGKPKKVTVEVQYKHPGDPGWSTMNETDATDPNPGNTGTFTAVVQSVPYVYNSATSRTQYRIKAGLYNADNILVGDSGSWTTVNSPVP